MNARKKSPSSPRVKQEISAEIVHDLMGAIRSSFYADDPRWFADQHFIFRNVVTWPASWLTAKGVTLSPERYKEIVLGVLMGIKQHGATGAVKYWPGYLMKCLQSHFKVHGEEIYDEGKAVRTRLEALMGRVSAQDRRGAEALDILAAARALTRPKRRLKTPLKQQLTFL